jgi:N-acetylglucosaminyl-diphospho-decaprenol L-rhamnosyltransferase
MNNTYLNTGSVSVIMPSYFTGPVLLDAIKSVMEQANLKELILVDNGNANYIRGKIEELALQYNKLQIISGQGNIGFARACNLGEKVASGEYLLLLHPDCILPENTFIKTVTALRKHPKAWVAGCKLVNPDGSEQIFNRRNILTFTNMLSEWLGLYKTTALPRVELHESIQPQGSSYIPAISGAFMFMERQKYKEIGGMDKAYFLHLEDMDFCFQVNEMGGKILFINDLEVVHQRHSSDVPRIKVQQHVMDGLFHYFKKNYTGAYPPGLMIIVWLVIYGRLGLEAVALFFRHIFMRLTGKYHKPVNMNRYVNFLEKYREFETAPEADVRDHKYYLTNRAPILITDVENQVGLCVLRRLLAANVEVIALYLERPLDIYHPKLNWIKAELGRKNLDLPKGKIKTVICTSPLHNLTPYMEKLAAYGVERLISFNPLTAVTHDIDIQIKRQLAAEQDIIRICGEKKIAYTMFHTSIIYGFRLNDCITSIYKFIRRFGFFPAVEDIPNVYQPVHADDLAIAALKILNIEETYNQIYNLSGSEEYISYHEIISKIFEVLDKKRRISKSQFSTAFFKMYTGLRKKHNINNEIARYAGKNNSISYKKAEEDFGFSARSFLDVTREDLGFS